MNRYTIRNCKYGDTDCPMSKLQDLENKIEDKKLVEVRHGEWIEKDDGWDGVMYTCSVCRCDWITIDGTPFENNMRYCPECGAKMRKEQNDGKAD